MKNWALHFLLLDAMGGSSLFEEATTMTSKTCYAETYLSIMMCSTALQYYARTELWSSRNPKRWLDVTAHWRHVGLGAVSRETPYRRLLPPRKAFVREAIDGLVRIPDVALYNGQPER